ncbi:MAG TPA: proton-conducting transporter membrane subunit [Terriglobales bacterium]|nr:proton-conducting transporter membrane subunit [Terriglobales bacterium]
MVSPSQLVLTAIAAPAVLLAVLGCATLFSHRLPEIFTTRLMAAAMTISFTALVAALCHRTGPGTHFLTYGQWSQAGGIALQLLVDRMSLAFGALAAAVLGIVSAFSNRYLHRDPGYNRYFVLLAMFALGMQLIALAGNVEVLFIGWELVGLSSALLVAFFHDRPAPAANALRVFSVYRVSDAAMLSAAVLLSHVANSDSLAALFLASSAGGSGPSLSTGAATGIAILMVVAVAGKSALVPFSGWLPRAMEGPTPSSAVYYGALSIHAGCFLMLRSMPLFAHAPVARLIAGILGATTAMLAAVATRVQSDVKSSLAYASLTQVGLIVVEIALGWRMLAFFHIVGHTCFRLLQFLSAPNLLHDLHGLSDKRPPVRYHHSGASFVYLFALERGFLDSSLEAVAVQPFTRAAQWFGRLDRRLCGGKEEDAGCHN